MNSLIRKIPARLCDVARRQNTLRQHFNPGSISALPKCVTSRSQSSSSSQKVYEIRTYSLKPKDVKYFLELSQEWMHLRYNYSKMIGYWISEIGGINDVMHIWEYDSLAHRAGVRQAMAKDETWVGSYFSKLTLLLERQENGMMLLLPGTSLTPPNSESVCLIEKFSYGDGSLPDITAAMTARQKTDGSLLGTFYSIIGERAVYQLWQHPDMNSVLKSTLELDKVGQFENLPSDLQRQHSRLLLPAPWFKTQ